MRLKPLVLAAAFLLISSTPALVKAIKFPGFSSSVTLTRLISHIAGDGGGVFSPNDSLIVSRSNRGGDYDWCIMDARGEDFGVKCLNIGMANIGTIASWSPDGKAIVFSSDGHLYSIPDTGGTPTQLTLFIWSEFPSYSPDGNKIVFKRHGEIWAIDARGENFGAKQLTSEETGADVPRWSIDGSKVIFARVGGYLDEIVEIDSAGEAAGINVLSGVHCPQDSGKVIRREPYYHPSGKFVSFTFRRCFEEGNLTYLIDANGEDVTTNKIYDQFSWITDWSSDGSKVLFSKDGDVWMASDLEVESICGDVNLTGDVTIADVVHLINFLLKSGPPPCEPD